MAGSLVLELRDEAAQSISYEVIILADRQKSASFAVSEADWWTTLLRSVHPYLLLEKYNDPQDPMSKDLIVYDMAQQRVHEVLRDFQMSGLGESVVYGYHPKDHSSERTFALDFANRQVKNKVEYPAYYAPGSEDWKLVMAFLEVTVPTLGCEYYEHLDYIMISYYERLGTKFDRKLLVMKGDAELYHQIVDSNLTGFASGSFFIFNDLLIFVQNGEQINAIELHP